MRWLGFAALALLATGCPPEAPPRTDSDSGIIDNDIDDDGFSRADGDCDDTDPRTYPGAWDVVGDDKDQNCDGLDGIDGDEDGYAGMGTGGSDCNDSDPTINPGADEIGWDLIDQNCDLEDQHDFTQLCAGDEHTCGIDTTGRIRCWGALDNRTLQAPPTDLSVFPNDGSPWVSIQCGYDTTCAVTSNGKLYCWGEEDEDHVFLAKATPVEESDEVWTRVFVGHYHACVLDKSGRATCFGGNDQYGQVSDVSGSAQFKEMALGDVHTCGIYGTNNIIECWGDESRPIYIESGAPDPTIPAGQGNLQLAAGDSFACTIRSDRGRNCWGDSERLDGNMPINESGPWGQLAAKGPFVCGLKELEPSCVGKLSPSNVLALTPTNVDMRWITAGIDHACGLRQVDGEPVCWGRDNQGQSTIPEWPNR